MPHYPASHWQVLIPKKWKHLFIKMVWEFTQSKTRNNLNVSWWTGQQIVVNSYFGMFLNQNKKKKKKRSTDSTDWHQFQTLTLILCNPFIWKSGEHRITMSGSAAVAGCQSTLPKKTRMFRLLDGIFLNQEVIEIMWLYKITKIHQAILQMDGSYFI